MPWFTLDFPQNPRNPSKADILDAFARAQDHVGGDETQRHVLIFHQEPTRAVALQVVAIGYGSDRMSDLYSRTHASDLLSITVIIRAVEGEKLAHLVGKTAKGTYDARSREGRIQGE